MTREDFISTLLAYESDELDDESTIEFFQHLVDTGLAWDLQGHYGRTAEQLIDAGYVTSPMKAIKQYLAETRK